MNNDNDNRKKNGDVQSNPSGARKPLRLSKESLKALRVRSGAQTGAAGLTSFIFCEGKIISAVVVGC
jgi:hypothetical protein